MPKVLIDFSTPDELNIAVGELQKLWGKAPMRRLSRFTRVRPPEQPLPMDSPDICPETPYHPREFGIKAVDVRSGPATAFGHVERITGIEVREIVSPTVDRSHKWKEYPAAPRQGPTNDRRARVCEECGREEVWQKGHDYQWKWRWVPPEFPVPVRRKGNG